MAVQSRNEGAEHDAVRRGGGDGRSLAASLPRLILDAKRIAASILHGLHGRRRAGAGENFWQYRRFTNGEPARRVDWRRSARDDFLYVREREWEASHTIWIWPDRSASMSFASGMAVESKLERGLTLGFALAEVLVEGGERVGIPGLMRPTSNRNVIDRMAEAILHDSGERLSLPPQFAPTALSEVVLLSDFWSPLPETGAMVEQVAANGAIGHLLQICDPAEETFPFSGRVEFLEPEGAGAVIAGRAETWRADYTARLANHRDALRAQTGRRGWTFAIHRTDRSAADALMTLHARMGSGDHFSRASDEAGRSGRAA